MFCKKNQFFGAGAGRCRAFIGGAGAKFVYLEPEPKKKMSGAGAEEKWFVSATLKQTHFFPPVPLLPLEGEGAVWGWGLNIRVNTCSPDKWYDR